MSDQESVLFAGVLAEKAIHESGLKQPFGGPEWPQKSGYEIQHEIYRTTRQAVADALTESPGGTHV